MEDPHSVSSPRRIHSLSKKRRETVSSLDADEKAPGFGVSGKHGPKPSEVYGFVGSITTVVATVIFLAWAYVPEAWLHYIGIFYYPSRYWALAGPVYVMMTIVLALGFYVGLNFMSTPYPTSLNTMFGDCSWMKAGVAARMPEKAFRKWVGASLGISMTQMDSIGRIGEKK